MARDLPLAAPYLRPRVVSEDQAKLSVKGVRQGVGLQACLWGLLVIDADVRLTAVLVFDDSKLRFSLSVIVSKGPKTPIFFGPCAPACDNERQEGKASEALRHGFGYPLPPPARVL